MEIEDLLNITQIEIIRHFPNYFKITYQNSIQFNRIKTATMKSIQSTRELFFENSGVVDVDVGDIYVKHVCCTSMLATDMRTRAL